MGLYKSDISLLTKSGVPGLKANDYVVVFPTHHLRNRVLDNTHVSRAISDINQKDINDCKGKTVLRFIDAHCHLHALAESHVTLNLEPRHNVGQFPDIQAENKGFPLKNHHRDWIRAGIQRILPVRKKAPESLDLIRSLPCTQSNWPIAPATPCP